jgi:hypothetical protein
MKLSVGGSTEKDISIIFGGGDVCLQATIPKKGHAPGLSPFITQTLIYRYFS